MSKIVALLFFFAAPITVNSQIFPKEGSLLNYRIIGFSFPQVPEAKAYKIEIAKGNYTRVDSFTKNIIQYADSKDNRLIMEVPAFGSEYTWRVVYKVKQKTESTPLYHFMTLMNDHVDTNKLHLRILQAAADQYRDDYVSVDAGGVLYDMSGRPVWFIPDTNGIGGNVVDLKFTRDGTITFFFKTACEINYNGDILWRAPNNGAISGDSARGEFYHHEFTKLSNGHYMTLGTQPVMCKLISVKDSSYVIFSNDKIEQNGYKRARFGTIIEYNENGKVLWSWLSSKYIKGPDFDYYESQIDSIKRFDPHDNAFFFDEKNKCVYLGFRNLNRIYKIDYPSGNILSIYGESFRPGVSGIGENLFCNQHSIGRTQDGYLYIFNNNSCQLTDSLPTVVIFQEPMSDNDSIKKIWEYVCTVDGFFPKYSRKTFGSGGNAIELPDQSLFVNMGSEYSKLFIVNRDKKILWSALTERFMETDQKWTPIHEYRANIISRKDLERLIWKAESSNQTH